MIKKIKNILKGHYYRYEPNVFLPVYSGGEMLNKKAFHIYRIKWIIRNRREFYYQLTHTASTDLSY